jgi:flagellar FliL protein
MSNAPTPPDTPAKKGSKKPVLIGTVAALALLGGGGFYWYSQPHAAAAEAAHAEPEPERGVVTFDPFVVNLADTLAPRFLRVTLQLVVKDAEQAAAMQASKVALMQARSVILELLTTQTSDVLVTPDGKAQLRAAIVEKVGHTVKECEVVDVLFSDFVVQF